MGGDEVRVVPLRKGFVIKGIRYLGWPVLFQFRQGFFDKDWLFSAKGDVLNSPEQFLFSTKEEASDFIDARNNLKGELQAL